MAFLADWKPSCVAVKLLSILMFIVIGISMGLFYSRWKYVIWVDDVFRCTVMSHLTPIGAVPIQISVWHRPGHIF